MYDAPPAAQTMPAAKLGLPPAYRVFHDELVEYGDWTLIEPYGWCFRPFGELRRVASLQPGWWEPSDAYGWIWNSTEPFGWITYHYGSWFYDRFGAGWQPGPVWGPAGRVGADRRLHRLGAARADRIRDVPEAPDGIFQFVHNAPQFVRRA